MASGWPWLRHLNYANLNSHIEVWNIGERRMPLDEFQNAMFPNIFGGRQVCVEDGDSSTWL
jgi:hypothetical protein